MHVLQQPFYFFAHVILNISMPTETAVCYFSLSSHPCFLTPELSFGPCSSVVWLIQDPCSEYRAAAGFTFNMSSVALPD